MQYLRSVFAVPRYLLAIVLAVAVAEIAFAQVVPGDSPDSGIGAAVRGSRAQPVLGISRDRQKVIYTEDTGPQSSGRRSPTHKPSGDPWKGIRANSGSVDRHQPQ